MVSGCVRDLRDVVRPLTSGGFFQYAAGEGDLAVAVGHHDVRGDRFDAEAGKVGGVGGVARVDEQTAEPRRIGARHADGRDGQTTGAHQRRGGTADGTAVDDRAHTEY